MALLVSAVVSYFLYTRIKSQYAKATQPIKIVAATKTLDAGATITADTVTLIDWPVNFPLEGAVTKTQDAIGLVAHDGIELAPNPRGNAGSIIHQSRDLVQKAV